MSGATSKILELIHNFHYRWVIFNADKKHLRWVPFIFIVLIFFFNVMPYITPQVVRADIGFFILTLAITVGVFYATFWYWKDYSGYVFLVAFIALLSVTYFIWFIPTIIFLIYFYYWLDGRRMMKIQKIATTPPAKLAKIAMEKLGPRVEVTVRTGGGGGK
jgi:hypothetical protein